MINGEFPIIKDYWLIINNLIYNDMNENDYFLGRNFEEVLLEGQAAEKIRKIGGAFLYNGTSTYLFSRTNYGKSLLVFQFAYAAATGTSFAPCEALQNDCPPMKTLVVDLELDERTLWERHGTALNNIPPECNGNLIYLHEKLGNMIILGLPLLEIIEEATVRHSAQLVIIDNISRLLPDSLKPETVTKVVSAINRIRQRTGAAFLVIGHTTKGNPQYAIQPTDYFGSSMIQNFFSEVSFLDKTKDGKFFLCHSKTKHKELYADKKVPVFTRGEHSVVGLGFTFQKMQKIKTIQLPFFWQEIAESNEGHRGRRDLNEFAEDIMDLSKTTEIERIAKMFQVTRSAIYHVLDRYKE